MKNKWYLQTWFIALCFALWVTYVPPIIGLILLILQYREKKAVRLKLALLDNHVDIQAEISDLESKKQNLIDENAEIAKQLQCDLADFKKLISAEKAALREELQSLAGEVLVAYVMPPLPDDTTSEEIKNKLSILKMRTAEILKSQKGLIVTSGASKTVLSNNVKQLIRCFNVESDTIIRDVTVSTVDSCRNKLAKSFEALNKIFATDGVALQHSLLEMKLEELHLKYAYQLKKQQERDEQKAIREQMLEEEKVRREIEREKAKLDKEESQFKAEIHKLMGYMQKADSVEKQLYINKITELEKRLKSLEKDRENVLEREQNTRAGFVYVISNIGSFGENVYKIGMTRRLEPMDRIKELGDASVPFEFDVHAVIFSEDAPWLENILHTTFAKYQVNKVNPRKEFFRVPLSEIEQTVKQNYNATVTFTQIALAEQYRESLRLENVS